MELHALPQVLFHEILSYLSPVEVIPCMPLLSSKYPQLIREFLLISDLLQTSCFGYSYFLPSQNLALYRQALLTTSLSPTRIFSMRAVYTSGGVFSNQGRYWVQNLFDYTGSVYTTNVTMKDVVVRGCFEGRGVEYKFGDYAHEDLNCIRNTPEVVPNSFLRENYVPTDTFLTSAPPQRINDFSRSSLLTWPHIHSPFDIINFSIHSPCPNTYTISVPSPTAIGLVTHVGIARPAFFTCPIKTVMVFTKLSAEPTDLSPYYGLSDPAAVRNTELCWKSETEDYRSIEFAEGEGALLWLQYKAEQCSQISVKLHKPRLMQYCEIILVDIDDRRVQYGYPESGIDITYVVFAGKIVPLELQSIYREEGMP